MAAARQERSLAAAAATSREACREPSSAAAGRRPSPASRSTSAAGRAGPRGVDAEVVERILAPLSTTPARYARTRVVLGAARDDGRVRVTVADDGPGVAGDARERIFEPGVRVGSRDGHGGAGLGLPLARPPRAGGRGRRSSRPRVRAPVRSSASISRPVRRDARRLSRRIPVWPIE